MNSERDNRAQKNHASENRIDAAFQRLREQDKKALITFVTAGCPDLEASRELVLEMERQGADIIELGIPFSDPIAEGPVIQAADQKALEQGVTPKDVFDLVASLRQDTQVPLVFLLYYNIILHMGPEKFFQACAQAGVDGVIIPDLPWEESAEIAALTRVYGVYQISMVAPTSNQERMQQICADAKGFLYCVSSLGVTGTRSQFHTDFKTMFQQLNSFTNLPKCIGFGISTPEHIRQLRGFGDGLIVGSALVKHTLEDSRKAVSEAGALTRELRTAMDE